LADGKSWNRSNWIAIEFNLLYRWHSMIPDKITTDDGEFDAKEFSRDNNELVLSKGVEWLIAQCSRSRAAKVCLFNTPAFLVDQKETADYPAVEERTISLMRAARLRSYNDYRRRFGLPAAKDFAQVTKNVAVQKRLKRLYKHVDRLEWYVGIFAEDYPDDQFLGELLTTMVGYDAFTQALTNPLLARNIFNEATFSAAGMTIIRETKSLQQILARNAKSPAAALASFEC
jgi:prostaglandin-endoperoxide synthase 2